MGRKKIKERTFTSVERNAFAPSRTFAQMVSDGTVVPAKGPTHNTGVLILEMRAHPERFG